MTPPWRAQDIGDGILGRPSGEPVAFQGAPEEWVDISELGIDADEIWVVFQPRTPVFWAMKLGRQGGIVTPRGTLISVTPRIDH